MNKQSEDEFYNEPPARLLRLQAIGILLALINWVLGCILIILVFFRHGAKSSFASLGIIVISGYIFFVVGNAPLLIPPYKGVSVHMRGAFSIFMTSLNLHLKNYVRFITILILAWLLLL